MCTYNTAFWGVIDSEQGFYGIISMFGVSGVLDIIDLHFQMHNVHHTTQCFSEVFTCFESAGFSHILYNVIYKLPLLLSTTEAFQFIQMLHSQLCL